MLLLFFSLINSRVSSLGCFFSRHMFPQKWLLFSPHMFHQNWLLFSTSTITTKRQWVSLHVFNLGFHFDLGFLRIRCWIPSLFNNKHWPSFRQQLGNICWLVKNSQIFRNCLYKTSDLIFRFGTKTLNDSSWDSYIIPHRIHVLKTVSHGCGTNRKDIFQFKQSSPEL